MHNARHVDVATDAIDDRTRERNILYFYDASLERARDGRRRRDVHRDVHRATDRVVASAIQYVRRPHHTI